MYLKSLEISGFKSFAKKTNLDFKTPITAIVGPNGSGKSNVAEAFRFVLGEQSLKSMRGKRGEDLIWNGGQGTVPRSNRASAKIVFDNAKRLLNIDYDEVSVERSVYRDSVSEYRINGTLVRLKDVSELLAGAHIGASGHHIISQGEADHILVANSRERREMIEDALGLKIYQYKKKESERKIEKTEENIKQVESLRREIAPHLKFLKKQVEKIEKTEKLKSDLKVLYKDYLSRENFFIESDKERIKKEKSEPEKRLLAIERELLVVKKELSESSSLDTKRKELLDTEESLSVLRKEKDKRMREIGRLEGEIASLKRLIEKIRKEEERQENASIPLSAVRNLAEDIGKNLDSAEQSGEIEKIREVVAKIRLAIKDFFDKLRNLFSGDAEIYSKDLTELEKEKSKEDEEYFKLEKREKELYDEYENIKNTLEKEKDKSREAEKEMFRLMAEQKEVYASLSILKEKEIKNISREDKFKEELREGAFLVGREILDFNLSESERISLSAEAVKKDEEGAQEERLREIQKIKIRIEDAGTGGSEDIMKEYNDANERDIFLTKELGDLEQSFNFLKNLINELDNKLEEEFKQGVDKINSQFQEFFALMFGGGRASIKTVVEKREKRKPSEEIEGENILESLENLSDEEEEKGELGIEIDIKLPRKNIRGLEMLSGGERALTSIALLFAISQVNPPPFIILDETDAALDEANSRKYGDMVASLSKLSQLILITHNRETMSRAGILYGITMGNDGVSKLLSVELEEAVAVAK